MERLWCDGWKDGGRGEEGVSCLCLRDVGAQRRRRRGETWAGGEAAGAPLFSLTSEVSGGGEGGRGRGGLSRVVKSICSGEGGEEKRLGARGKEHKGKIVHWERCSARPAAVQPDWFSRQNDRLFCQGSKGVP